MHYHIDVWRTGATSREFLHVDDAAEGIVLGAERYEDADPVNLGVGREITIRDLVQLIARLTRFDREIAWDASAVVELERLDLILRARCSAELGARPR